MTRIKLKSVFAKKSITIPHVASALGVTTMSIYDVLMGRRRSRRIEVALERILDMPIEQIHTAWQNNTPPALSGEAIEILQMLKERQPKRPKVHRS